MKRIMKISVCLMITFMTIFFGIMIEKYFHKNYISREIFESINYVYQYDNLIRERRGEYEEKIVYTKDGFPIWLVSCDDIKVLYDYDTDTGKVLSFMCAQTTDSSYTFGEKGIRVGMDRDVAEKILKNSKKPKPNPHQESIFDDDDKISHISLYLGL